MPVFAGKKPVAWENELQLIAWLGLPENVQANTPVDVTISLDEDCICSIKVKLLDGSGRPVEANVARGDKRRDGREIDLYNLRKTLDQTPDDAGEDIYSRAIEAANRNRDEELERSIGELKEHLSKVQSDGHTADDWIERAEGLISYTDYVLERFGWLIEPMQRGRIRRVAGELSEAVCAKDSAKGTSKLLELDTETDRLPPVVLDLMAVINGSIRAERMKMLIEADKLRTGGAEIERALRNGDYAAANSRMSELVPILDRVFSERGTQSKISPEGLLRK